MITILVAIVLLVSFGAVVSLTLGLVPESRAQARGFRWLPWLLYGNDDGGIYGERDSNWLSGGNVHRTAWTAIRWWFRNPFHNLTWHVLRRDTSSVRVIKEVPTIVVLPYRRKGVNWVSTGRQYQSVREPFFVSWRGDEWEGYVGWRENGVLGVAFRKHHMEIPDDGN